jgi:hypothetical protein
VLGAWGARGLLKTLIRQNIGSVLPLPLSILIASLSETPSRAATTALLARSRTARTKAITPEHLEREIASYRKENRT